MTDEAFRSAWRGALGFALLLLVVSGCDREVPASERGAAWFRNAALSTSPFNHYSCATCHVVDPLRAPDAGAPVRLDPGFNLANSVRRPSWWGGDRVRLLDAINVCLREFMGGRDLRPEDESARQLYEYLADNSPDPSPPALPLHPVAFVTDLGIYAGQAAAGEALYRRACYRCHGQPHTGAGRLSPRESIIPEDTIKTFADLARGVAIEKIRHGKFFGIGGSMPFYATEVLSDQDVVDLVAYLGL